MAPEDEFGSNEWLVEEMRRRFQASPDSVSDEWKVFFRDQPSATPPPTPSASTTSAVANDGEEVVPLVGGSRLIAERMEASRELPTATSVRSFPAKLLEVNRRILNNQLNRLVDGGKVSFTHLIGWAIVKALGSHPSMNVAYRETEGKPATVRYDHINLGLAVDMPRADGTRMLMVPNIKSADAMDFRGFWLAYEDVIQRLREGRAGADDFAGTTLTLTNPGTVGTLQSVPRLMPDQGTIVGVGAIKYPPEWEGADPRTLAQSGVGRVITLTSTYDHRVIQGAESGAFLGRISKLLLGEDDFYDEIFRAMAIPYVPARWARDQNPPPGSRQWAEKQARIFQLINMYRVRGHLIADLDPLRMKKPAIHAELDPLTYGVTIWDLDREFATGGLGGREAMKAGDILGLLRDAYGRTVGIEYMHIQEPDQKAWIQQRVEGVADEIGSEDKLRILRKLNEAEVFERFLHTKYVGQKRFSLQGSESFIPLLDTILGSAADAEMDEVAIGMAHRGRLNVLANIVGKSYAQIFKEFEGEGDPQLAHGSGDVKYHLGAKGVHKAPSGAQVDVYLSSNPSHLEAVDPVLEGMVRAEQDRYPEGAVDKVLPLLVHGDAAFAGQGVVAETFNLSQLDGYHTGGTVHIVVNNQVGFTTAAEESRSSEFATDVAKAVQAPIFHVNADDPEAVVRVARLAFGFRQAFHKDVVIDLLCYRRYGHNEGDDPSFTQPIMYRAIEQRSSARDIYLDRLVRREEITLEEGEEILENFRKLLDQAMAETKDLADQGQGIDSDREQESPAPPTAVDSDVLQAIHDAIVTVPDGFTVHPKMAKALDDRTNLWSEGRMNWAMAEAAALGSLALEGRTVRLAGEDTRRGTFSHRHAVLVDYETEDEWVALENLSEEQGPVYLVDSFLSEFAAMGFEYGYSVVATDGLVAWEAQFGDFVNGAQVVIDQFLAAGEDKWGQSSSLVLLLPHGFEGQGPEHSSARIERFLQNAAEDNMRIVVPSTPSQYFHALRRQPTDPLRKPLIMFTPKSLLRTRASFSPVVDITTGGFRHVIEDEARTSGAKRVLLCTGKVYYDLARHRDDRNDTDHALVRIEQLYPFPDDDTRMILEAHPGAEIVWVQEEPENMGAWTFALHTLARTLGITASVVARRPSASPATGSFSVHAEQQKDIVRRAFG
jgi:2-oxoglutarate dehydrogenase E1 component